MIDLLACPHIFQILAFTRQTYDDTKTFSLPGLVTEILAILKITIPSTIIIQWEPPEEKIPVVINPVKFKQVIMNLCLNAVQAMGGKRRTQNIAGPGTPRTGKSQSNNH